MIRRKAVEKEDVDEREQLRRREEGSDRRGLPGGPRDDAGEAMRSWARRGRDGDLWVTSRKTQDIKESGITYFF